MVQHYIFLYSISTFFVFSSFAPAKASEIHADSTDSELIEFVEPNELNVKTTHWEADEANTVPESTAKQGAGKQSNISRFVKITGKLAAQGGGYGAWGIPNRRDPYSYLFVANVNIRIWQINIPFSAIISQQETTFLQPFNKFGASPHYKWITVHAGYRTMQFSNYTLNDHLFLGVGVELNPELKQGSGWKLRVAGMWGRFRRAVDADTSGGKVAFPVYKRRGYGFKLGVEKGGSFIDFILFKAKDDESSIGNTGELIVRPQENLVLGTSGQLYLFKRRIVLKGEFASSAYTRDTRSPVTKGNFYSGFGDLFTTRTSTYYDYAVKSSAAYQGKFYSVGITYSRITGDYRSMGTYFFQNDVQDITGDFSIRFLKNTASVIARAGGQRTNLNDEKQSTNKRFIASISYNQVIKEKLNINLTFSNFSSSLKLTRDELTDSLNLYQVSRNYSIGLNYNLGQKAKFGQGVWLTGAYQEAYARQEYEISKDRTQFYSASAGHQISFNKSVFSLSTSFNFSASGSSQYKLYTLGPSVSLNKRFLENKMRLGYTVSYIFSHADNAPGGSYLRNTISWAYKVTRHHALSAGIYHFTTLSSNSRSFSELRGEVKYEFTF